MTDLLDRIRAVVGEANVIVDTRLEDYEHDGTFLQHELTAAVLPAGTEEVAQVVKLCAETRTPLTTRGAYKLYAGSAERNARVRFYKDGFARIQAGDYEGTKEIDGVARKSIFREYADSVADGLSEYYSETRGL